MIRRGYTAARLVLVKRALKLTEEQGTFRAVVINKPETAVRATIVVRLLFAQFGDIDFQSV